MNYIIIFFIAFLCVLGVYKFGFLPIYRMVVIHRLRIIQSQLIDSLRVDAGDLDALQIGALVGSPRMVEMDLDSISAPDFFMHQLRLSGAARSGKVYEYNPFEGAPGEAKKLGTQLDYIATKWMVANSPMFVVCTLGLIAVCASCKTVTDLTSKFLDAEVFCNISRSGHGPQAC